MSKSAVTLPLHRRHQDIVCGGSSCVCGRCHCQFATLPVYQFSGEWVTGSEWEGKPIPFQSTLPYRHCSSAFVDYSAFLYCLQMRKIKSGKSDKGGECEEKSEEKREPGAQFLKGIFPRSSRPLQSVMFTFSRIYLIRLIRERALALGKA